MSIEINLMDNAYPVLLDERTPDVGGSFYYRTPIRVYSPYIHRLAFDYLMTFPHAVMLDIGASTGCYGLLAKHHPDLRVYAFEPAALSAEIQRENMKLNGLYERVKVYETAVSDYNGKGVFHQVIPIGGLGVSMLDGIPHHTKQCEDFEVDVITVDTFCNHNDLKPDLIKVDTEGGELMVLKGAEKTIRKYHPILIVEVESQNTNQYGLSPSDTVNWMKSAGYEVSFPFGDSDAVGVYHA